MENKQQIVFALYKNDKLIGYRQDTFGTLGTDWAKVYTYSPSQVETVLKNITSNVKDEWRLGKLLGCETLEKAEAKNHQILEDEKVFEVRVLECPPKIYETEFNVKTAQYETSGFGQYDKVAMDNWFAHPEDHICLEKHLFSLEGKLNMQ